MRIEDTPRVNRNMSGLARLGLGIDDAADRGVNGTPGVGDISAKRWPVVLDRVISAAKQDRNGRSPGTRCRPVEAYDRVPESCCSSIPGLVDARGMSHLLFLDTPLRV